AALELSATVAAARGVTRGRSGPEEASGDLPTGASQASATPAMDRNCVALATVLATIGALGHLNQASQNSLRHSVGAEIGKESLGSSSCGPWAWRWQRRKPNGTSHRQKGRNRIQRIASASRSVLRPGEMREALSMVPPMILPGDAKLSEDGEDYEEAEFLSISDVSEELEGPGSGFERRSAEFPCGSGPNTWAVYDPSNFKLRSQSYFVDAKKVPSGPAMLEIMSIDWLRIGPRGPVTESASHGDFCYSALRRSGDTRFMWIFNWVIPPYQALMTAAVDPSAPWLLDKHSPQARVWNRFLEADPEERRSKLKLVFSVETGPWVVKKLAIPKPTLIGKKLAMASKYVPGDFIEITMDVTNGGQGGGYEEMVTQMVLKQAKHIDMCVCVMLEATEEDELPETALFAACCRQIDMDRVQCPVCSAE
ncbi:unnamed protein product, partial [Polarella glacialis]